MNKKHKLSNIFCSLFIICILFVYFSCDPIPTSPDPTDSPTSEPTAEPTEEPTAEPTEEPTEEPTPVPTDPPSKDNPGAVWFEPGDQIVANGSGFRTEVHVNSGSQMVAAYGIDIFYDSTKLALDTTGNPLVSGADGYISALNINNAGVIVVGGFDAAGKGPGEDLHLFTVNWIADADGAGETELNLNVKMLVDEQTAVIGTPLGIGGLVRIQIY